MNALITNNVFKIAIIDFYNQDVVLKILFPEAEYFILQEEFDRSVVNSKYNIIPIVHNKNLNVFNHVINNNYDSIFIIAPLWDSISTYNNHVKPSFNVNTKQKLIDTINMINCINCKNIFFVDNYDYDYDPNNIFMNDNFEHSIIINKNIRFFKRNFQKNKTYFTNVFPFPYITFGHNNIISIIDNLKYFNVNPNNRINRIFFSGNLFSHDCDMLNLHRDRIEIMNKISTKLKIYNPGSITHETFMYELSKSKYCLDILGVGDPNTRTHEILVSGSLKIAQRSNLKWNFDDDFCEETIFDTETDLLEKINRLENDADLYKKCLDKQNFIFFTYMNKLNLRNYILDKIID